MHLSAAANTQSGAWARTDVSMFSSGGAIPFIYSPHWAATMPEPESLQQLFVIHTQCIQPLPSLPSSFWCDTYWQVQDLYASARICL